MIKGSQSTYPQFNRIFGRKSAANKMQISTIYLKMIVVSERLLQYDSTYISRLLFLGYLPANIYCCQGNHVGPYIITCIDVVWTSTFFPESRGPARINEFVRRLCSWTPWAHSRRKDKSNKEMVFELWINLGILIIFQ